MDTRVDNNQTEGGESPPKRIIKPHKGGRSARVYLRAKPEIKAKAQEIAAKNKISVDDLFEQLILAAYTSA